MHVNLQFGGKQPIMHDTQITDGCLGMHAPKLQVGDIPKMVVQTTDKGPFYLSQADRELLHYDQIASGSTTKPKNMTELKKDLLAAGVSVSFGKRLHIANLNMLAFQNGIPANND